MITVRFASGFSVQYNDLTWVEWGGGGTAYLYAAKGTGWKVMVPPGALIEFVAPCRTYNAPSDEASKQVWELTREVRLQKASIARLVKEVARVRK